MYYATTSATKLLLLPQLLHLVLLYSVAVGFLRYSSEFLGLFRCSLTSLFFDIPLLGVLLHSSGFFYFSEFVGFLRHSSTYFRLIRCSSAFISLIWLSSEFLGFFRGPSAFFENFNASSICRFSSAFFCIFRYMRQTYLDALEVVSLEWPA